MSAEQPCSSPVLEVRGLGKSFGGHPALRDINLTFNAGEVHALMGENGAGKSTLMKIIAGLEQADVGEIRFHGESRNFRDPHEALQAGIAMIHQELMPFPNLTVAENIFIGREPTTPLPGMIARRELLKLAGQLLIEFGLALSPETRAGELKVSELQMIEIVKAVSRRAEVLIMDEPTSSLSDQETKVLFELIAKLRTRGIAIIYISHRMEEIFHLADRISVLRDGCHVSTDRAAALDSTILIQRIAGRLLGDRKRRARQRSGREAISVCGLSHRRKFRAVSFKVHYGEVLGIAGLMGAGRTEVAHAIFGLEPADSGEIQIESIPTTITRPADAIRAGIALVTEDRKRHGLVLGLSVAHNLTLTHLGVCCWHGVIQPGVENDLVDAQIQRFGVKARSRDQAVKFLSGGNQQKVVIAKALLADPKILILDEPTRGVDIGAKREIYDLVDQFAAEGRAVILVSSELPELMTLSDRILVMREGAIVAELDPTTCSQQEVIRLAMPAA